MCKTIGWIFLIYILSLFSVMCSLWLLLCVLSLHDMGCKFRLVKNNCSFVDRGCTYIAGHASICMFCNVIRPLLLFAITHPEAWELEYVISFSFLLIVYFIWVHHIVTNQCWSVLNSLVNRTSDATRCFCFSCH